MGLSEIIFIAVLALIFIGPKQLPEVARTVGRFLNELKRSTSDFTDELKAQAKIDRIDLYSAPKKPEVPKTAQSAESVAKDADVSPTQVAPPIMGEYDHVSKNAKTETVEPAFSAQHNTSTEPKQIELFPLTPEKKDV